MAIGNLRGQSPQRSQGNPHAGSALSPTAALGLSPADYTIEAIHPH